MHLYRARLQRTVRTRARGRGPINLLYPPRRHQSTIVRTYLDFCQSYLPKIVQACET
jgi:hypothetical protein